jgi:hypothetical protein
MECRCAVFEKVGLRSCFASIAMEVDIAEFPFGALLEVW